MKRVFLFVALVCISLSAFAAKPKLEVKHIEPLSWWVGMNTPLQLMINGNGISEYDVAILPQGQGVEVKAVHKADSPNYLFVDVAISADAKAGEYTLRFTSGKACYLASGSGR